MKEINKEKPEFVEVRVLDQIDQVLKADFLSEETKILLLKEVLLILEQ